MRVLTKDRSQQNGHPNLDTGVVLRNRQGQVKGGSSASTHRCPTSPPPRLHNQMSDEATGWLVVKWEWTWGDTPEGRGRFVKEDMEMPFPEDGQHTKCEDIRESLADRTVRVPKEWRS